MFNAETIVLNTEESIEFVNELIRPDSDYIASRNAIFTNTTLQIWWAVQLETMKYLSDLYGFSFMEV